MISLFSRASLKREIRAQDAFKKRQQEGARRRFRAIERAHTDRSAQRAMEAFVVVYRAKG